MDIFGAARRKIGNAIAGTSDTDASNESAHTASDIASPGALQTPQAPQAPQAQTLHQTAVIPTTHQTIQLQYPTTKPAPVSSETVMTPEQLKARRIAQIENADIGQSKHVRFFIFLVSCWLFIGPPWYVVLTTSEVGWALSRRSFIWGDQTSMNFYAGALFIELGMMFSTFFLAYLRQVQSDQENRNRIINRAVVGLTIIWFLLASISAFGQFYYLFKASTIAPDPYHIAFVASRVLAFTVVDFATAFYLSRIQSTLDEIMETNRKKGKYHVDMAQVDGDLLKKQSEADMAVEQARIDMEDKRRKNEVANRVITTMTEAGLRVIESKFQSSLPELAPSSETREAESPKQILPSQDQTP
jgi:hypothetical protein